MPPKGGGRGGNRPRRGAASSQSQAPEQSVSDSPHQPGAASAAAATPTSEAPTHASSSRDGPARAGSSAAAAKFRPKGNRRSEAERSRIAQEQQKIQNKKIADEARQRSRGRLRRAGRARGTFRDRGGGARLAAGGPLTQGTAPSTGGFGSRSSEFGSRSGGGGGSGDGGFRGKTEGPNGGGFALGLASGREHGNRINVDELCGGAGEADEHDQSKAASLTRKSRPVMPVGIRREEARDKGVKVATAAEIEGEELGLRGSDDEEEGSDDMWIDDQDGKDGHGAELEGDEKIWGHAAPKPQEKVQIKTEDGGLVETMEIDEIAAHQQQQQQKLKEPLSPEAKKATAAAAASETKKKQKKRKAKQLDTEDEQFSQDLEQLLGLLAIGAGDQRDQADGEAAQQPAPSALEGNMFLFQFPPVLPPLHKKASASAAGDQKDPVKAEPDDDVVMLDQPARGAPAEVDLTAEDIKAEEALPEEERAADGGDADLYKNGGCVGQLVMRKSGKVELSWGGQTLQLVPGTQAQFLNTAVLLEENDTKAEPGQIAGTAFGMGRIEGKFTLAPKWGEEEEWDVDDEDLVAP